VGINNFYENINLVGTKDNDLFINYGLYFKLKKLGDLEKGLFLILVNTIFDVRKHNRCWNRGHSGFLYKLYPEYFLI